MQETLKQAIVIYLFIVMCVWFGKSKKYHVFNFQV